MRSLLPLTLIALAAAPCTVRAQTIAVPAFRSVALHGGGEVVIVPGAAQRVTVREGSTNYSRLTVDRTGRLVIEGCRNDCPRNYRLRVEIQSPRVPDVAIIGGGLIRAAQGFRGQSQIAAAIHGGGKIDVKALDTGSASTAIVGGGEIHVRARSSLAVAITGGGSIRYWGDPQVDTAIQGGGWVRRGEG